MKKMFITLALVLALSVCSCAVAQEGGGLFQRGGHVEDTRGGVPGLPGHGAGGDQPAPVGTGALALALFGSAYLVSKKLKENE